MQWEAKVASGGDKTKEDEVLIEINKLVGEQLQKDFETDKNVVAGD